MADLPPLSALIDDDAEFNARMELTQLRAGAVLTSGNEAAIKALFDEMETDAEAAADAFDRGLKQGREEAGGLDIKAALEKLDEWQSRLAVEKALKRFYAAENARLKGQIAEGAKRASDARDSWGKAESRVSSLTDALKALWLATTCGTERERTAALSAAGDLLARIGALAPLPHPQKDEG